MRDSSKLPGWPACMRAETAAAYLDVSAGTLRLMVDEGRLPAPTALTPGCKVWRRVDLDLLIDRLHGTEQDRGAGAAAIDPAGEWDRAFDGGRDLAVS